MSVGLNKDKAVIYDLDGVLACNKHRMHHIKEDPSNPDWDKFYETMEDDPVLHTYYNIMRVTRWGGFTNVIVTNRPERYREPTERWLRKNLILHDLLLMRDGHHYNQAKVHHLKALQEQYHVVLALDDDPVHCQMYEEQGVPCVHVPSGYYDDGRIDDNKIVMG